MKFAIIEFSGNSYGVTDYSDQEFANLAYFLTCDVGSDIFAFEEWLNTNELAIHGNYSWLEKWNNNILIGCLFDHENDMYKYAFPLHQDEFLKTLKLWQKLCKERHTEIHIKYENGKITMEGRN